jgi:ParB family chromosome partitioning protein
VSETTTRSSRRRRFTVDSLFADTTPRAAGVSDLPNAKEIRLNRISPDPAQPRQTFDDDRLAELAESMRLEGVLQPIAVRYERDGDRYIIIHGERRWRAARMAGLESIPAIVREVPEERRLIQQLMENVVREDLNAIDRAAALRALKSQMNDAPWEQVAEAVGIRRSRLFQLLGTEKLPESVQQELRAGRLSEKQTRVLQGLPETAQDVLARLILSDDLAQPVAQRLARAVKSDPSFVDLDEAEVERRFSAMRQAIDASAQRSKQRVTTGDRQSAIRQLLADSDLDEIEADASWNGTSLAELDQQIVELARSLLAYQAANVNPAQRKALNERLRALHQLIDDIVRGTHH